MSAGSDPLRSSPIAPERLFDAERRLRRELPADDGSGAVFSLRQAEAIERRGETLVSAGAGAGKTSVLVERYLRLLEGDDTLATSSVLAITFTEKAAAEMRERVRGRLEALVGGDVELPERWRLEDAWIGTFHGVAQRLLRRYALAAGIDPDADIADEGRARELRHQAFERALTAWLEDPARARGGAPVDRPDEGLVADGPAALGLAAAVGLDALRDETLGLLALRRTQGRDPATTDGRALPVPPRADVAVRAALRALRAAATPAADEARAVFADGKPTEAAQRALDLVLDAVSNVLGDLQDPDAPDPALPPADVLAGWALPNRSPKVGKGPAVGALRDALAQAVQTARAVEVAPAAERDLRLREALLVATARAYRRLKRERSMMDFDDLLLALLALLRRRPDVQARLQARFRQVLVDEYQDTNPVQLELVERLSHPAARFQVGDRLQAIYGFRHATVAGFDRAAERAAAGEGRLLLDETFRCPSDVLAVTNRLGALGHVGYQPLVGGHDRAPGDERDAPPVELHVLGTDPRSAAAREAAAAEAATVDGDAASEPGISPGEAEYVAGLVAALVTQGRRPGEIAILVRRTAPVPALERALQDRGIDAVPVVARPLLRTLEAQELEAWLRAVLNPLDDVALLGALRLPTAGVDADGLVPLAAEHRDALDAARETRAPRPALWDTLRATGTPGHQAVHVMPDDARDELDLQTMALVRHRALARRTGPAALLADVRSNEAYRAAILDRPGGPRRWAAVEAFVAWAEEQEALGDDLPALLRRIEADRDGPDAPVLTDGDAVRITTVHRSKGLEWPVVLCCDLGAPINAPRAGILLDADPAGTRVGLRTSVAGETLKLWDYDELAADADRAQAEEERRLVHVALTRAKERLLLCGAWPRATEGTGAERILLDRLDETKALDGIPGDHDVAPRTAPLRWLLPRTVPVDAWPGVGEDRDVAVEDPTGSVTGPATVRLVVRDPALPADEDAPAVAPVPAATSVGPGWDPEQAGHAPEPPPALPLPDPVSFTALAERLGLEVDPGDVRHDRVPDDEERTDDDPAGLPAIPPPTLFSTAALDARTRGVAVHGLLEARLSGPTPPAGSGVPATAQDVRDVLAEEAPGLGILDDHDADSLLALAARLEDTDVVRVAVATPLTHRHVERPFLFDVGAGRPLVQGFVDLWLDGPDGRTTIVDWKTNRLAGRAPSAIVDAHYALQRDVYALAALLAGATHVDVVFVFAEAPEQPAVYAIPAARRDDLEERVAGEIDRAGRAGARPVTED